jgi:outer membrane scaffolding protein for murein synthesis (MipA/OmpV family)
MVGAHKAGRRLKWLIAGLLGCAWAAAEAKEEPLLEFGLGIGAIAFEDYRGSNTAHAYPLPIPYLLYNGKFLKADREGLRGTLFNQDWVELNLSGNATTPVEASPKFIGWTFTPRLALDVADPFKMAGWNAGVLVGPLFADRRYHDYFYSVARPYATVSRPAYQAAGGYAGTQFITALSKRYPRYWVGAYVRYDTLSGAAFADSPLVQRNSYWSGGIGISWMIHTSTQMVEVPD